MSGRASSFGWAAAAVIVGTWAERVLRRAWKPLAVVALAPLVWLWSRAVMLTGSVRGGTLLLVLGVAAAVALGVWGYRAGTDKWAGYHRRDQPAAVAGGPDPLCLYRWWEPTDLPYESRCACGKPRLPGELVYVGITNDLVRRSRDDDRRAACWWHVGLVGTVETYGNRAAMEAAERTAIATERPRENVAHAGRR